MNNTETMEIINDIKTAKIDVRKTIENTIKSGYMDPYYYVDILTEDNYTPYDILESFENPERYFEGKFDDEFYAKVEDAINNNGAYIVLEYLGNESFDYMECDFGIKIQKINDEYNIIFGERGGACCQSPARFYPFENTENETLQDIEESCGINIIKKMYDVIVFE